MKDIELHRFTGPKDWKTWLEENHTQDKGIWMVIQKVKSPNPGIKYNEALDEALCYGWIDGQMKRLDEYEFRQWFSPRRRNSPWSKRNREKAETLIEEGRMMPSGFREIEKAKKNGKWETAYTSKKPPTMQEDMIEELKKDKVAYENFLAFSNSTKTTYIYWVNDAKRINTRKRRIQKVVERAKMNLKPGIDM
jgi:uncharacterized protein YdeI (YjbR/CyaY-like superfamily)